MAHAWKACMWKRIVGSNPTLSAVFVDCRFATKTKPYINPATLTAVFLCGAKMRVLDDTESIAERVKHCGKFDTAADIGYFFPPDARPKIIILCMRIQYPPRPNMPLRWRVCKGYHRRRICYPPVHRRFSGV